MRLTILIFIILLSSFNCKTNSITSGQVNDDVLIVKKVIKLKKLEKAQYYKDSFLNTRLLKMLDENIHFEKNEYSEFGDLRNIVEDSILDKIFNKSEIYILKEQLKEPYSIIDLGAENTNNNKSEVNINFTLSKPIYFIKKQYALIMYSYGNINYDIGRSGVILLEKINDDWVFVNEFWNGTT